MSNLHANWNNENTSRKSLNKFLRILNFYLVSNMYEQTNKIKQAILLNALPYSNVQAVKGKIWKRDKSTIEDRKNGMA
ncbi:CLUMA_CG015656, isoform A [Clunio marinus]|uniref:CLUMA_CG015656, isoform A n=1 Tax=Clunio marinus TaxID=568069 RepID=A0A1J1IQM3_9DIPT|nr:CLUMA_CG015656, isoform A [Clunio marinus]